MPHALQHQTLENTKASGSAVVHHLKPHKGDLELFFDLHNLQSVCWTCHSGDIQSTEAMGYDRIIGADGWPIDPKHPYVT
ncbi:MAG: HNH endonuclease [Rhodobacteraceae bacterium]|nr:HNH endonuclease [Paracoccaceae bacterium]